MIATLLSYAMIAVCPAYQDPAGQPESLGIGVVVFLIKVWRKRGPQTGTAPAQPPVIDSSLRDRIRQETTY